MKKWLNEVVFLPRICLILYGIAWASFFHAFYLLIR